MSGVVPHSAVVATQYEEFLDESLKLSSRALTAAKKSPHLRGSYKSSVAAFCILNAFSKRELPLLKAAAETVRRVPFLLALQQRSLLRVELRRFIELVTWYPYFSEHPIEWSDFVSSPDEGFARSLENPIAYCAHRERAFYSNYIKERYGRDRSGLVCSANADLSKAYTALSFHVHATSALRPSGFSGVLEGQDTVEESAAQKLLREILSSGCIVAAAVKPSKVSTLSAVERGWFDWLVGNGRSMKIRAGDFCRE